MSRIGKKPVSIPSGVTVEISGQKVKVASSAATLTWDVHPLVTVAYDADAKEVSVTRNNDDRLAKALHGTTRALIANMVEGVSKGYKIDMEIYGTGYGIKQTGQNVELTVGTAKPHKVAVPAGVTVEITTPNARGNDTPAAFNIKGADKQLVGQLAAKIRKVRPPEPYQGKGIRYKNEHITRKSGKAFGS